VLAQDAVRLCAFIGDRGKPELDGALSYAELDGTAQDPGSPVRRYSGLPRILRRRILYADGFPIGDPEVVFKFRDPDLQRAAKADLRPQFF